MGIGLGGEIGFTSLNFQVIKVGEVLNLSDLFLYRKETFTKNAAKAALPTDIALAK